MAAAGWEPDAETAESLLRAVASTEESRGQSIFGMSSGITDLYELVMPLSSRDSLDEAIFPDLLDQPAPAAALRLVDGEGHHGLHGRHRRRGRLHLCRRGVRIRQATEHLGREAKRWRTPRSLGQAARPEACGAGAGPRLARSSLPAAWATAAGRPPSGRALDLPRARTTRPPCQTP